MNRTGKATKKEDYVRTDNSNIGDVETETKQHVTNLEHLE